MDSVSTSGISSFRPALLNRFASTAAIGSPDSSTTGPLDGSKLTPGARIAAASERLNERWLSAATSEEEAKDSAKTEEKKESEEADGWNKPKTEASNGWGDTATTNNGWGEGDQMMQNIDKLRQQATAVA